MMKPDQRERLQRITRLRLAANVITALKIERPELVARILLNSSKFLEQLTTLADQYEAHPIAPAVLCKECREGTCKIHVTAPLRAKHERVSMAKRRKPIPARAIAQPADPLGMTRALRDIQKPKLKLSGKMREIPIAQREFDGEAEHEEGQTYGHDIPDGSD